MRRRIASMAFLASLALSHVALAQEYLDRGTFVITRGGAETGRMEYAVRVTTGQTGTGGLLVVGTTRTPAHEVQYILETTRDLAPLSYQQTESVNGRVVRRVSAQVAGPRFSVRATTDGAEASRELPVRAPFAILGADDYTAYLFVPRADAGASRPVNLVRTETLTPVTGTVQGEGDDTVTISGTAVECRRYTLRLADGDTRSFWITPTGSLIQVAIPSSGLTITRTQAPSR